MKLLAACHEEVQALEASKNLLTINARILALMGLLQRHRAKSVMMRKGSRSVLFYNNKCWCIFILVCYIVLFQKISLPISMEGCWKF